MIFIFAQPPLLPAIRSLLADSGLFHGDLDGERIKDFLICRAEGRLAGVVGMEVRGAVGLLRSLAVEPSFRGRGIASLLLVRIERFAALQGVRRFFLLTLEAPEYFIDRGYAALPAAELPEELRTGALAQDLLARGGLCLVKPLTARKVPEARREMVN
ncbi:GNAT family N-acetyltransferase [Geoalkalibacter sp.]|uniref:GNAT family N-acetyltransferase n=1 Tax=Geoalkalibacter sp. TaxID=3041440 RepID=UPI00272E74B6|nr:GNAT family N-acetyltransferase [Geoalkalibacter sp.]